MLFSGSTPPLPGKSAVATLGPMRVNGTPQWVRIRGRDVANPLLLFVHGTAGTTQALAATRALEEHFVVAQWDPRGVGRSASAGAYTSLGAFVDDVADLSSRLALRYGKQAVLLVGHSWGSAAAMLAVAKHPRLFSGYVGVGQVAQPAEGARLSYAWTRQQAQLAGDAAALAELDALGPPSAPARGALGPPSAPARGAEWCARHALLAKFGGDVLLARQRRAARAVLSAVASARDRRAALLVPELLEVDLFTHAPAVAVPVWFCLGRHDQAAPAALAARYFEALRAPRKELAWFEQSAHWPHVEEPDAFARLLLHAVRSDVHEA